MRNKLLLPLLLLLLVGVYSIGYGKEVFKVGTDAQYKPYEYYEKGKLKGFDIELMEAIAKKEGFKLEWHDITFGGLLTALQLNKIDLVISGLSDTEEREKSVDFSKGYITAKEVMLINSELNIKTIEDLDGKKMGASLGSHEIELAKKIKGLEVVVYDNFTQALLDLENKKIDCVMIDINASKGYLNAHKNLKVMMELDGLSKAIAFKKGNPLRDRVNRGLEKVKADGTYDKLMKKYFKK